MKRMLLTAVFVCLFSLFGWAQTTAFNFQGRLNDGNNPANGHYDLQFLVYDAIVSGNQVGATISQPNLMLVNGVFSTQLDFGLSVFTGADRFMEIRLRPTTTGNNPPNQFVILGPRQQILSVPYTIRSTHATIADDASHAVNADNATNAVTAQTSDNSLNLGGTAAQYYVKYGVNGSISLDGNLAVSGLGIFDLINVHRGHFSQQNGVEIDANQPFLTLTDSSRTFPSGSHQIQSANGAMYFYLNHSGSTGSAKMVIDANGNVGIGVDAPTTKLEVAGTTKVGVLQITGGSDLAEKFEFSETVQPGMVVAVDADNAGKLMLARGAYNRRAAGVVSGANNLAAGMVLPDLKSSDNAQPVALSGRVWVYCDATKNPVRPGDLLTTSSIPGYAMKITDYKRAAGATIGKAMTGLKAGKGLVLVLVSLQ